MLAHVKHIRQHRCSELCREFLQLLLGWLYMGATGPPVYPCCGRWVHAWHREGEAGPSREPGREETMPMRTYAFCVLQTFHRLCKTSESVRPLELWEEGREGGGGRGQVNWQVRFQGNSRLPPISPETLSKCGPPWFCPIDPKKQHTGCKHAKKIMNLNWTGTNVFYFSFSWFIFLLFMIFFFLSWWLVPFNS